MQPTSDLEVVLEAVYSNGLAYFKVGQASAPNYIRHPTGLTRKIIPAWDLNPKMTKSTRPSPFAEAGKKFASLKEATHYVEATHGLEALFIYYTVATSNDASEEERKSAVESIKELQQILKADYIEVLESLSDRKAILNLFLNSAPDQIRRYLDGVMR